MSSKRRRRRTSRPREDGPRSVPINASDEATRPDVEEAPPTGPAEAETEVNAGEAPIEAESEKSKVRELEERLKRAQAEFVNETKRIKRQSEDARKYAIEGLIGDLLPVVDALHSAREAIPAAAADGQGAAHGDALREGLDLVEKELLNVLGRHGVERIEAAASPFDPNLHEALFVVDHAELPPGTVAQVLRPGFTLHGRVVRPAHVAVTQAPESGAGGEDARTNSR